jgi:hypothetical protein
MTEQKRKIISSSLGSMPINERKSIVVDDPTEEVEEVEEEELSYQNVLAQRSKAKEQQKTVSPTAKSKFELLLGIGRKVIDVAVDDHIFTLRTLKNKEQKQIILTAAESETVLTQSFTIKDLTLAYSLFKIDSEPVENVLGQDFSKRLELIEELDGKAIDKLYEAFKDITNNDSNDLGTTTEEVVENIKK